MVKLSVSHRFPVFSLFPDFVCLWHNYSTNNTMRRHAKYWDVYSKLCLGTVLGRAPKSLLLRTDDTNCSKPGWETVDLFSSLWGSGSMHSLHISFTWHVVLPYRPMPVCIQRVVNTFKSLQDFQNSLPWSDRTAIVKCHRQGHLRQVFVHYSSG